MDTAQRGMGLDWPTSLELIRRSLDAAQRRAGRAAWPRGCGTDHLAPEDAKTRRRRDPRLRRADGGHREARRQADRDGQPRAGARGARARPTTSASTTASCRQAQAAGGAALAGRHVRPGAGRLLGHRATSTPRWTRRSASSPRTRPRSTASRSRCSTRTRRSRCAAACRAGVRMYTGDDFNYAELIAGDGFGSEPTHGKSDALLGIFDAIAPAASAALGELAQGNVDALPRDPRARPCRCRATSSRRRRASTRPAWCSWPGSTATRTTSRWSAASRARARCRTWPSCSAWPMRPACWSSPSWRCAACRPCWRCTAST